MSVLTCPVVLKFLNVPLACDYEVTTRITLTCDYGCPREPLHVCSEHTEVIARDDPDAVCAVCDAAGRPESRVHCVSMTPILEGVE